jgi:hypothetical protein
MSLSKLTIQYEMGKQGHFLGRLEALFNPTQLAYSKSVTWSPSHTIGMTKRRPGFELQYQSSAPETLTVELFFDAYATDTGLAGQLVPPSNPGSRGVLPYTEAVAALARVDTEMHRPPVCRLRWGKSDVFQGILQQTTRTLLMFLPDGTPVRATVSCTFLEYPGDLGAAVELHSPDVAKQYTVRPGDTLMGIASELYGDSALWRRIAEANHLENPRGLTPGQRLSIPRLR